MKKFTARAVKCYEEDGVLVIALGDDSDNPANYIIITRFDDEDNDAVDDDIGFQTDQAEYEKSDVIKKVVLSSSYLEVEVKPSFAKHFGGSIFIAEISQESEEASAQVSMLKSALQKVFDGSQVELSI